MSTLTPFRQTDRIADHIFPLVQVAPDSDGVRVVKHLGTGFFAGENLGLTARHVLSEKTPPTVGLMINHNRTWRFYSISTLESHSTEDVCAFLVDPPSVSQPWTTFIQARAHHVYSSFRYQLWGYPQDVLHEVVNQGIATPRPDLVYSEGYVRRRISGIHLDHLRGLNFLELSQRAGRGFSGGPVIATNHSIGVPTWHSVGIYIGERESDEGITVGYAARFDAIEDWQPSFLAEPFILQGNLTYEPRTGQSEPSAGDP